jgi:hypothetical protein
MEEIHKNAQKALPVPKGTESGCVHKTEQFSTCTTDTRPNHRVAGKAPRTTSQQQKEG